jgi:hypothetical protein
MAVLRKIIFSLLISALILAVFAGTVFIGPFDLVETRFYNPRLVKGLDREVREDARVIGGLLDELRNRFIAVIGEDAVRRSFLPHQAEEDILERSRIFGSLLSSLPGLRSVRFVDAGGSRIHFSTLPEDLSREDGFPLVYRAYQDCPGVLPYDDVETAEAPRLIFDGPGEQLVFSYPFTDTLDVYRGSALFTFSARTLTERMVQEGRVQVGEDIAVVSSPGGFLLGLPAVGKESLKSQAAALWGEGNLNLTILDGEDLESLALISAEYGGAEGRKNPAGGGPEARAIFVGRLARERLFVFSPFMEIVLLGSFFLTVFLLVFLFFNLRPDSAAVVNSRLNRLRDGLFRQYHRRPMDRNWARELEQRREEVRAEIKRDLPAGRKNSALQAKIDALIDRSWDEVVAAADNSPKGLDEEELEAIIAGVFRRLGGLPPGKSAIPAAGLPEERAELKEADSEAGPELLEELEAVEEPAGDAPDLTGDDENGAEVPSYRFGGSGG